MPDCSATSSMKEAARPFVLWFDGIRRLPAVAPPLLGLAAPITGAAIGWVALGQSLTTVQLAGFAVTLGAIAHGATRGASEPESAMPGVAAGSSNVSSSRRRTLRVTSGVALSNRPVCVPGPPGSVRAPMRAVVSGRTLRG